MMSSRQGRRTGMVFSVATLLACGGGLALAGSLDAQPRLAAGEQQHGVGAAGGEREEARTEHGEQREQREHAEDREQAELVKLSQMKDEALTDEQDQEMGELEDLVIDVREGRIAYGLVRLDETELELEHENLILPFQAFERDADREQLRLTIGQQELQQAEGYEAGELPDLADRQWGQQQHETFGFAPYWEEEDEQRHQREREQERGQEWDEAEEREGGVDAEDEGEVLGIEAREQEQPLVKQFDEIVGLEVRDPEGEQIGEIEDLVVDSRQGRVIYAIVAHGGFIGIGEEYVAVPFRALEMDAEEEAFTLDADEQTLEELSYSRGDEPDWNDQEWAQQTHEQFGQEPYWEVYGYAEPGEARADEYDAEVEDIEEEDNDWF